MLSDVLPQIIHKQLLEIMAREMLGAFLIDRPTRPALRRDAGQPNAALPTDSRRERPSPCRPASTSQMRIPIPGGSAMKTKHLALLGLVAAVACAPAAFANEIYAFSFNGNGVTASGTFKVGSQSTNSATPPGYEITGISGTFSDTNVGVSGAITGLYTPVSYVSNTLANPGVAFTTGGLSYDDLFYPAGDSPAVCLTLINGVPVLTYPFSGGYFDIFGVAFNVAGGYTGAFWSNGDVPGLGMVYAAGLADANGLVDNPNAGPDSGVPPGRFGSFTVSLVSVPEPDSLPLFGIGLFGLAALYARKRKSAQPL
jgi:hypothetical protein